MRKLYIVNKNVTISGKISYFNKKYQITNPDYVTSLENESFVKQKIPKYSLTKGINEKKYRSISEIILNNLPDIEDWHDIQFLKNK